MDQGGADDGATRRLLVVTPARDEAAYLPGLVEHVLAQHRRPDRWVIVSDGSVDGTGDLARRLTAHLPWVTVIERASAAPRGFGAKARAVDDAVATFADANTEMIATLDADVQLPPTFFATVVEAFDTDPRLGVFGGVYTHRGWRGVEPQPFPPDVVPGGVQAVRRATFDDLGGYWTLPFGGIDLAMCIGSQSFGWVSRHDPALVCRHLRDMGTGGGRSTMAAMYSQGRQDWDLGSPPLYELGKVIRWIIRRPLAVGAVALALGYVRGAVGRRRSTPAWFVTAARQRQQRRVRLAVGLGVPRRHGLDPLGRPT